MHACVCIVRGDILGYTCFALWNVVVVVVVVVVQNSLSLSRMEKEVWLMTDKKD